MSEGTTKTMREYQMRVRGWREKGRIRLAVYELLSNRLISAFAYFLPSLPRGAVSRNYYHPETVDKTVHHSAAKKGRIA